jgi:hypothetical protein
VRPATAAPAGASSGVTAQAASPPPAPAGRRSPAALFLDHRAVAPNAFDRYGNPPRRDLSRDELVRIAAEYDLVDDNLRGQPDGIPLTVTEMDEMRRINPRLKVVRYLWTLSNNDVALSNIEPGDNAHETWFLRDANGDYVRAYDDTASWNQHVNYVLDPANVNVRLALGAQARVARKLGYDGVLLDDVLPYVAAPGTPYARSVLQAHPIDPATGAPYIDDAWRAAVLGLIEKVREIAGPGTYVIASGMTGSDYIAAHGDGLLPAVDAVLLHPFAGDGIGLKSPGAGSMTYSGRGSARGKTAIAYAPSIGDHAGPAGAHRPLRLRFLPGRARRRAAVRRAAPGRDTGGVRHAAVMPPRALGRRRAAARRGPARAAVRARRRHRQPVARTLPGVTTRPIRRRRQRRAAGGAVGRTLRDARDRASPPFSPRRQRRPARTRRRHPRHRPVALVHGYVMRRGTGACARRCAARVRWPYEGTLAVAPAARVRDHRGLFDDRRGLLRRRRRRRRQRSVSRASPVPCDYRAMPSRTVVPSPSITRAREAILRRRCAGAARPATPAPSR